MDVNEDCIIDRTDADLVLAIDAGNPAQTVSKELYTLPVSEARTYKRYTYATGNTVTYTLAAPLLNSTASFGNQPSLMSVSPDVDDYVNTNVALLYTGTSQGSAFIVGPHVVATVAHCVYTDDNPPLFESYVRLKIYNASCDTCIATLTPINVHVPLEYTNNNGDEHKVSRDYALLYFAEDLTSYGIWKLGVAAEEFKATGGYVTTSGFTRHGNGIRRYYSTGAVTLPDAGENYANCRIRTLGYFQPGKSGCVMYYTSACGDNVYKSAIAIGTGFSIDYPNGTWGVRMNPTLLKFYKQNPYLV